MNIIYNSLIGIIAGVPIFLYVFQFLYDHSYPEETLADVRYMTYMSQSPLLSRLVIWGLISFSFALLSFVFVFKIIKTIKHLNLEIQFEPSGIKKTIVLSKIFSTLFILTLLGFGLKQIWQFSAAPGQFLPSIKSIIKLEHENQTYSNTETTFSKNYLIAHAGGGIDGHTYTNSYEALEKNYAQGHRVFEINLNLMPDGKILCSHDIEHLDSITGVTETFPNTGDYKARKIYDKYTVMDLEDLFRFMIKYKDVYVVTDSKLADATGQFASNDEYNQYFWEKFVSLAKAIDASLLNRIIPQLYYPEMLKIVDSQHAFQLYIFTLYATSLDAQSILRFVYENPRVGVVTMPPGRLTEQGLLPGLRRLNIPVFVHTINEKKEIEDYVRRGVYGFYTDFVTPQQFADITGKR